MNLETGGPKNIDEYIAGFPDEVQDILQKIRLTIKNAAPDAEEAIKYQLPTFTLNGNLVHFGAFKKHIGFYPTPNGITAFKNDLSIYENGKGSIQFPLHQPIPYDLIGRIVTFRVQETLQKAAAIKRNNRSRVEHKRIVEGNSLENDLPPHLAKPAQRALAAAGYYQLAQLAQASEAEIKRLHGIGPNALKQLRLALDEKGLSFTRITGE